MSNDENIGIIKNLFGQENTFTTPRLLVLLTQSHTCALLLNQIIFWSSKKYDGWFYKSYDEWLDELLLTKKQVMAYAKKLESMGLIERKLKKVKGAPNCWYRSIDGEIIGLLQKVTMESDKRSQTGKVTKGNKPYTEDYITEDYLHKELKTLGDSTNTPTDITPSSKIKDYEKDERFMRFYSAYPKKVKPRDAWKAFKNIVGKNDELLLKILVDLKERSTRHSQWQEKQYIPYPATYLRSADYDSEIINEAQESERKRQESKAQAEQRLANQESLSKQRRDMERINNESKHNDAFAMKGVVESTHPSAPPPEAWNALKKKLNIRQG